MAREITNTQEILQAGEELKTIVGSIDITDGQRDTFNELVSGLETAKGGYTSHIDEANDAINKINKILATAVLREPWTCKGVKDGQSCDETHPGNEAFCGNCGAKRPEPKAVIEPWACPNCGKNDCKQPFCCQCGKGKPETTAEESAETNPELNEKVEDEPIEEPVDWDCECGENNPAGKKFCGECGKAKPEAETKQPASPPPAPPTTNTNSGCGQCGRIMTGNKCQNPNCPSNPSDKVTPAPTSNVVTWACPHCKVANPIDAEICERLGCGRKRDENTKSPARPAPSLPIQPTTTNNWKCSCGKVNGESENECPSCGAIKGLVEVFGNTGTGASRDELPIDTSTMTADELADKM